MDSQKQQEEMRSLTEENKRKKQRSIQPSNAASSSEQRAVIDNSDYGVGDNYQRQSKIARFNELWEIQGSLIQEWFMEAFSYGNPNPKLAEPHVIESTGCKFDYKQISIVDVYMLHNVCTIDVEHCKCRGLVKALILMRIFPSSAVNSKKGCHFVLLDFLHLFKMKAHVSNHSFTNVLNQHLSILKSFNSEVQELSKNILNFSYQAYRKIVQHVQETIYEELVDCYGCEKADVFFGAMDGNFQLERKSTVRSTRELFGVTKNVARLWGTKEEVERFAPVEDDGVEPDCLLENLDSNFKAARNNNRQPGDRFDENGVFTLCCVPYTMYDIYSGEGRKYALTTTYRCIQKTCPAKKN